MVKDREELIQFFCNQCRGKWVDQDDSNNLISVQSINLDDIDSEEFWAILRYFKSINNELAKEGFCLSNIVINSTMDLVNIQKLVNHAIERWNEVCKNCKDLKGITIITSYNPKEFELIKIYLANIQIYAKNKNFDINLDCLANRLLVSSS